MTLRRVRISLVILGLTTVLSGLLIAQTSVLDLKLGLWELTTMAQSSSGPAIPPETDQHCITKDSLQKSTFLTGDFPPGYTCKQTLTTNSRTVSDFVIACTGASTVTFSTHVEALSTTSIRGTAKVVTVDGGTSTTTDASFTGKWVASSCKDR
jgi:hypothetical protein